MATPTASLPAFPDPVFGDGLSKREYFAALAMQGMLAGRTSLPDRDIAVYALSAADALLAALEPQS